MEIAAPVIVASSIAYTTKKSNAEKKQIKAANAAANQAYELEKQEKQNTLEQTQLRNRNLLLRQQSQYKAKLGASGLSQTGSGQVVLDNMKKEHDAEDKYLTEQADISMQALLNGINETNTRNLLELQKKSYDKNSDIISGIYGAGRKLMF